MLLGFSPTHINVMGEFLGMKQIKKEDETAYLLKSEANKKHLLDAIKNVKKGNLIYVDLDEYEKIAFE
jgi:PHD/YefM family antitoxin component YafN of YafNO toxin-antitoxin module